MTSDNGLNRRNVLQLGLLTATAASGLSLAACKGESGTEQPGAKKLQPLDLLRVGAADATPATGVDPRVVGNGYSTVVVRHIYDSLLLLEEEPYKLGLAETVTPNSTATKWTIKLRDGVTFHNGAKLTSKDVVFSIKTLASPPSLRASLYADVDLAGLTAVDERTVEVALKRPRGDFKEAILMNFSIVFPDGTTDFNKGIGSGPYKLDKFDDNNVRLVANDKYWQGAPNLKALELTRIKDASARLSAVKAGQIDYAVDISTTGAQAERANKALAIQRGGVQNSSALSFSMNQSLKPFDDPRVRKAVRLAADRQALVDTALMGLGVVGDDIVGKGLPGYSKNNQPKKRDVAQAKQLFADAGVKELTIRAAEIVPGMLSAVKLFAQQLAEAGVTLTINQVPADTYYADLKALVTFPFQTFYYGNRPVAVHFAATTSKNAFFNVTQPGDAHYKKLADAQTIADGAARSQAFEAMQKEFYDNGGDLIWGFQEDLDISRAGISGIKVIQGVPAFAGAGQS